MKTKTQINGKSKKSDQFDRILLDKQFKLRNAPLVDRFQNNPDFKTAYTIFRNILLYVVINCAIYDYLKTEKVDLGLSLIRLAFNKFHWLILMWLYLYAVTWLVFALFHLWARIRLKLVPNGQVARLWDRLWLTLLVVHYIEFLWGMQTIVRTLEFAPGSAAVLMLEGTRLLMKQHAFVRTNIPKVLQFKPHSGKTLTLPTSEQFAYFTFAPTLIYRDKYPRTGHIRWTFVFSSLVEVLIAIWFLSLVVDRLVQPYYKDFGLRKFTKDELRLLIYTNGLPGALFMMGGFYAVLHSSQNAFAEMLRFGDRQFYKEWWIASSMSEFYRTWNVIVHDWLRAFIYKEMYQTVFPKNKFAARLTVFVISALMHEWIMTNCLGFFLPVQFVAFFLAGAVLSILNMVDTPVGSIVIWYGIIFAMGSQINLYTVEFFARLNCPPVQNSTVWGPLMPRFVSCLT